MHKSRTSAIFKGKLFATSWGKNVRKTNNFLSSLFFHSVTLHRLTSTIVMWRDRFEWISAKSESWGLKCQTKPIVLMVESCFSVFMYPYSSAAPVFLSHFEEWKFRFSKRLVRCKRHLLNSSLNVAKFLFFFHCSLSFFPAFSPFSLQN